MISKNRVADKMERESLGKAFVKIHKGVCCFVFGGNERAIQFV